MPMPCTTALVKSFAVNAAPSGITPAIAVVMKSARVVAGLASHTNLRTRGKAAVVPATDCLKLSHRPRRSLGPSSTDGSSGSAAPVRPLLAGPVSACFRLPSHQWIIGGPLPGPIVDIVIAAYPQESETLFPRPPLLSGIYCVIL